MISLALSACVFRINSVTSYDFMISALAYFPCLIRFFMISCCPGLAKQNLLNSCKLFFSLSSSYSGSLSHNFFQLKTSFSSGAIPISWKNAVRIKSINSGDDNLSITDGEIIRSIKCNTLNKWSLS